MPDRPDNQATTAGGDAPRGRLRPSGDSRTIGQHLDTDALSAFIDDRLGNDLNGDAVGHIAVCPDCRNELAELRATVTLLRGLPEYRSRRSFTLGPEYAHPVRTSRLARLLPMLPVLRSATVAVLLLLVSVSAADILTQVGDDSDDSSQPAALSTDNVGDTGLQQGDGDLAAAQPPPESESAPVGDGTGGGDALSESDGESNADDVDDAARSAGGDAAADERIGASAPISAAVPRESEPESAAASGESSASDSAAAGDVAESASDTDAASADEAPENVALGEAPAANDAAFGAVPGSTEPAPTVSIATASVDEATELAMARADSPGATAGRAGSTPDAGLSNWRLIEIVLALVLVALAALLFGLHRLNTRVRRIGVIR